MIARKIVQYNPETTNEKLPDEFEKKKLQLECTAIPLEDRKQTVLHKDLMKNSTRNRLKQ